MILGLKKEQTNSGSFQKGEHRSRKTEFRPGQIPHNKGVLASPELRAKNSAAQKKRFEKIKPTGPCVRCGSKTTYVRPDGREEWRNSENGDICNEWPCVNSCIEFQDDIDVDFKRKINYNDILND